MAAEYERNILADLVSWGFLGGTFKPLMTIYLTDHITLEDIRLAKKAGVIATKLYPANATTNSALGVTDIKRLKPALEMMAEVGLVLSVHGETLVSKEFGDAPVAGRATPS